MGEMKSKVRIDAKSKNILFGVLLLGLLGLPLFVKNSYYLHIIILCFIYGCLSLSLNLIIGWSGQFSLGHVTFYGMGAYITAILVKNYNVNFFIAMLISVGCVAIFSALLCIPTLNLRGDYIAVVTLGFGEIFQLFLKNAIPLTRGPMGIPAIPEPRLFGFVISGKTSFYFFGLILLLLFMGLMVKINNSGIGLSLMTVNEDDIAAMSLGINPVGRKFFAFVTGGAMAAIVGSFYAVYMGMVGPTSFGYGESIKMVSMVVLGGMGNIVGTILGATVLAALPEVLRTFNDYRMVIYGAAMVIMMIFRPNGIWGRNRRIRNEYKIKAMRGAGHGKNIAS